MDYKTLIMAQAFGGDGGGTEVIANPTLDGTEEGLNGLQVGETKYKVGKQLYKHIVHVRDTNSYQSNIYCTVITDTNTAFTLATFGDYIKNIGVTSANNNEGLNAYPCSGFSKSYSKIVYGVYWNTGSSKLMACGYAIPSSAYSFSTDEVTTLVSDIVVAL